MRVKVIYSKEKLEAAVNYIAMFNPFFKGQKTYIKESILESAKKLAKAVLPNDYTFSSGTMGYTVIIDSVTLESVDEDDNEVWIDILVDPALGPKDHDDEYKELVVEVDTSDLNAEVQFIEENTV